MVLLGLVLLVYGVLNMYRVINLTFSDKTSTQIVVPDGISINVYKTNSNNRIKLLRVYDYNMDNKTFLIDTYNQFKDKIIIKAEFANQDEIVSAIISNYISLRYILTDIINGKIMIDSNIYEELEFTDNVGEN